MKKIILLIALSCCLVNLAFSQTLPSNSVGKRQLKNNSVNANKVKDESLTSDDILNDSVTADDISEVTNLDPLTLTNGQSQNWFTDGTVTLSARCAINEGGNDIARVLVFSTIDGTAFDGDGTTTNLLAASPDTDREIAVANTTTTQLTIDQESDGYIMLPDGTAYILHAGLGTNLFGNAGTCNFSGHIYKVSITT